MELLFAWDKEVLEMGFFPHDDQFLDEINEFEVDNCPIYFDG